jgi:hypothetical protein
VTRARTHKRADSVRIPGVKRTLQFQRACPTQSGHSVLRIVATQMDSRTYSAARKSLL